MGSLRTSIGNKRRKLAAGCEANTLRQKIVRSIGKRLIIVSVAYLYGYIIIMKPLSKKTFWDVEITETDLKNSQEWIINRIFDRGTLDEVLWVINYYGFDFVKQILTTTADNLPNHAILLARAIFKLNYSDFKCSERKPSQIL